MTDVLELIAMVVVGVAETVIVGILSLATIVFKIVGGVLDLIGDVTAAAVERIIDLANQCMDTLKGNPNKIEDL